MTNGQFGQMCFIYFISKWQINPFNTASYFAFTGTGSTRMSPSSYLANMNTLNISPSKCRWKSVTVHIARHSLTKPRDNNKHYVAGTNQSQFLPWHFFCIMRLGSELEILFHFLFRHLSHFRECIPYICPSYGFHTKPKKGHSQTSVSLRRVACWSSLQRR